MSDVEVPLEDAYALETDEEPGTDEDAAILEPDELDLEAPEADVVEQRRVVELGEDDYQ